MTWRPADDDDEEATLWIVYNEHNHEDTMEKWQPWKTFCKKKTKHSRQKEQQRKHMAGTTKKTFHEASRRQAIKGI